MPTAAAMNCNTSSSPSSSSASAAGATTAAAAAAAAVAAAAVSIVAGNGGGGGGRSALLAALADALAGALGSVVAAVTFYPIDIAKTRAQASSSPLPSPPPLPQPTLLATSGGAIPLPNAGGGSGGAEEGARGEGEEKREGKGGGGVWVSWLFKSRTLAALVSLVREEGGVIRLFEGIESKALQALIGSFIYFYAYSFIKAAMRRRIAFEGSTGGGGSSLRPSLNLLAAALAGAVNQAFTLPLENITTRMQTAQHRTQPQSPTQPQTRVADSAVSRSPTCDDCGDGDDDDDDDDDNIYLKSSSAAAVPGSSLLQRLGQRGGQQQQQQHNKKRKQIRKRQSIFKVARELYCEEQGGGRRGGLARFWRGFAPSLILTCNPAINYTAFDVLKALWLNRRAAVFPALFATASSSVSGRFLGPFEAFFIAALAKSLATIITYPLIRAKVLLMTKSSRSSSARAVHSKNDNSSSSNGGGCRWPTESGSCSCSVETSGVCSPIKNCCSSNNSNSSNNSSSSSDSSSNSTTPSDGGLSSENSSPVTRSAQRTATAEQGKGSRGGGGGGGGGVREMGTVMLDIVRKEGIGGLYAGCGAQLLHTILKSALLLATKEEIARAVASAVFFGGRGVFAS